MWWYFLFAWPEFKLSVHLQFVSHTFLFMNKCSLVLERANELRALDVLWVYFIVFWTLDIPWILGLTLHDKLFHLWTGTPWWNYNTDCWKSVFSLDIMMSLFEKRICIMIHCFLLSVVWKTYQVFTNPSLNHLVIYLLVYVIDKIGKI